MRLTPVAHGTAYLFAEAAVTAAGLTQTYEWLGIYATTQSQISLSLVLAAPMAAAAGAHAAGTQRRGGLSIMARGSSRSALVVALRQAEAVLWIVAGYLAVYTAAIAWTATFSTQGSPRMVPLIVDLALLVASALIGVLLGDRLPRFASSPAAFVLVYVTLGFGMVNGENVLASLTTLDYRWAAFSVDAPAASALKGCWLLLLTAGILYVRAGRGRAAVGILWTAGAIASVLLFIGTAGRTPVPDATEMSCTRPPNSHDAVCLPAAKSYLAGPILEEQRRLRESLGPLIPRSLTIVDDEVPASAGWADLDRLRSEGWGGRALRLSDVCDLSAYTQLVTTEWRLCWVLHFVGGSATSEPALSATGEATAMDIVLRWAFESLDLPTDGSAAPGAPVLEQPMLDFSEGSDELRWLESLSEGDRNHWLRENRSDIRSGRLSMESFEYHR